jgi:hypothetical protein
MAFKEAIYRLEEALIASGLYRPEQRELAEEGAKWMLRFVDRDREGEALSLVEGLIEDLETLRDYYQVNLQETSLVAIREKGLSLAESEDYLSTTYGVVPSGTKVGFLQKGEEGYLLMASPGGWPTLLVEDQKGEIRKGNEEDYYRLASALEASYFDEGVLKGSEEAKSLAHETVYTRYAHLVAGGPEAGEAVLRLISRHALELEKVQGSLDPLAELHVKSKMPVIAREAIDITTDSDPYALKLLRSSLERMVAGREVVEVKGGHFETEPPPDLSLPDYATSSPPRATMVRMILEDMARGGELSLEEFREALSELREHRLGERTGKFSPALEEATKRALANEMLGIATDLVAYLEAEGFELRLGGKKEEQRAGVEAKASSPVPSPE